MKNCLDSQKMYTCILPASCFLDMILFFALVDLILFAFVVLLQVLTLASNERIPLTPSMRLLFEIAHLKTATPATVSRAGILFVNAQDLGWNP